MTTRRRLLAVVLTAVVAASVLIPPDVVIGGPPTCLVRLLTGFDCPGCGMTRALVHLSHGRWSEALSFHPLVALVAPLLWALWAALVFEVAARRDLLNRIPARRAETLMLGLAALFVAVWVVRTALRLAGGVRPWQDSLLARLFGG